MVVIHFWMFQFSAQCSWQTVLIKWSFCFSISLGTWIDWNRSFGSGFRWWIWSEWMIPLLLLWRCWTISQMFASRTNSIIQNKYGHMHLSDNGERTSSRGSLVRHNIPMAKSTHKQTIKHSNDHSSISFPRRSCCHTASRVLLQVAAVWTATELSKLTTHWPDNHVGVAWLSFSSFTCC